MWRWIARECVCCEETQLCLAAIYTRQMIEEDFEGVTYPVPLVDQRRSFQLVRCFHIRMETSHVIQQI